LRQMKNKSIEAERVFKENGLTFTEIIRQEYGGNNCIISAGFVKGKNKPKVDTCYLRLEKDNVEPTVLLLRPDEIQSIAWVTSGTVWAHLMSEKDSISSSAG
jgi:hypothetical protein